MAKSRNPTIKNRKASHNYFFLEEIDCGIVLKGTEVKSIREGKVNFGDAFCFFKNREVFVKDLHISPYSHGNIHNEEPLRDRKLLLSRREIDRLKKKLDQKGLTVIPIEIFFSDRNMVKVKIALVKGKKLYDKRDSVKEKDTARDVKRELKGF